MTTDEQMVDLTTKFMSRVNLTGEEVPAFNACLAWLADNPQVVVPDVNDPRPMHPVEIRNSEAEL